MFERRRDQLARLADTGVADLTMIMKLSHKSMASAAAAHAGLAKFLSMEMTPTVAQRPLATSNEILLKIGAPPTPPRQRLEH
jgi:hypothetical protein